MEDFIKNIFMSRWFFQITFTDAEGNETDGWRFVRAWNSVSAISKVKEQVESDGGTDLMFVTFNKV